MCPIIDEKTEIGYGLVILTILPNFGACQPGARLSDYRIDNLDLRIIAQLQDDGRKPTADIARELGMPRTTVARRLERLLEESVITVGVFANGSKIGLPIHVMIEIWVDPTHHDAVVSEITALDEIRWIGVASGPFDVLVEAMVRSPTHLRHLLLRKFGGIHGITRTRTAHILEVIKITFDWERMLRAGEEAERIEVETKDSGSALSTSGMPP